MEIFHPIIGNAAGFILSAGFILVTGCSDQPKETWAQDSRDYRSDRDAYIRVQTEQGVDPARARQLYDANVWKLNTEGIDPASVYQAPEKR
ncbi:MAG TPA: hypothetical protein PKE26_06015 [Kiritimatiellia bacterium]|nr:hypothetical protein [Kiritimatiellia bacterium]HMO98649.1 hypothetical protein [Kiritimatiellia bacterium]HMP91180.1 hypothetical protein [Kiritimatiellia bacterium]